MDLLFTGAHRRSLQTTPFYYFNPLTATVAVGTAIKHPLPDRVKASFVIFDIRAH